MLCKFKYLNNGNTWTEYGKIVSPINFGDTIKNEASTAYAIRLYFENETIILPALEPGTIVSLDFGTKEQHYVIVDGGKIEPREGLTYCYHSYTIQELLAVTREIFTQTAYFSYGQYTLEEFFERLLDLSQTDRSIVIDESGDYQVMKDNWNKQEYQISSNALLDNLVKVGQMTGVRIKARINADGKIELYFKSLRGSRRISTINGQLMNKDNQYMGANIASRALAQINNMTNSQFSWYPSVTPLKGLKAEPEGDTIEIAPDSAVIKLPYKVKNATSVKVFGTGKIVRDNPKEWTRYLGSLTSSQEYRLFDTNNNRILPETGKYVGIDYEQGQQQTRIKGYSEFEVISYDEWKLLDVDGSNGAEKHQENMLYFKPEDNKIYNIKTCEGKANVFGSDPIAYVKIWDTVSNTLIRTDIYYPELKWHKNRYIVNASFYSDALISVDNGRPRKRMTMYSQEDNIISAEVMVKNLNNYIKSMKNSEEAYTYEFNSIDDVPEVGDIYKGKVISQVNCNGYYKKIEATISLSDELVKKSEYLSAYSGLELPKIDIDKAFSRFTNYKTNIWFCRDYNEAQDRIRINGMDKYYNHRTRYDRILNSIINDREETIYSFDEAQLKMGSAFTSLSPNILAAENSLMVIYKTINNLAVGYIKDSSLGNGPEDLRYYPAAFTEGGKHKQLWLRFKAGNLSSDRYPLIDSDDFYMEPVLAEIKDDKYHHDPAETLNINYQIEAKTTDPDGYIKKEYWEESSILNELYFDKDEYDRYVECSIIDSDGEDVTDYILITPSQMYINEATIEKVDDAIIKIRVKLNGAGLINGATLPDPETNTTRELITIYREHKTTQERENLLKVPVRITEESGQLYAEYHVAFASDESFLDRVQDYRIRKDLRLRLTNLVTSLVKGITLQKNLKIKIVNLETSTIRPKGIYTISKNLRIKIENLQSTVTTPETFVIDKELTIKVQNLLSRTIRPETFALNKQLRFKIQNLQSRVVSPIDYNLSKQLRFKIQNLQADVLEQYSVSYYNLIDGTNNASNPATFTRNDLNISLLNPTRSGYGFAGWYNNPSFYGYPISKILEEKNYILYAKWQTAYSISYTLNGGTNHPSNPNYFVNDDMPIELVNPYRANYNFNGWFENGNQVTTIDEARNYNLEAEWTYTGGTTKTWTQLYSSTSKSTYPYDQDLGTLINGSIYPGVSANNYAIGTVLVVQDSGNNNYYWYKVIEAN